MTNNRSRSWILIGIGLALLGAVFVIVWMLRAPAAVVEPRSSTPIAEHSTEPNDFQKTRELLGPWTISATPHNGDELIMLMNNGTTYSSATIVHPDTSWKPYVATSIVDVIPEAGMIKIRLGSSATFTLYPDQAFVLEGSPLRILAFVAAEDTNVQLVSTTVGVTDSAKQK